MSDSVDKEELWLDPEVLNSLINYLRKAGYKIGVPQYLAAQQLALFVTAENITDQFENFLRSIFCKSEFEQEEFEQIYAQWFERHLSETSHTNSDVKLNTKNKPMLLSQLRQWLLPFIAILLMSQLCIGDLNTSPKKVIEFSAEINPENSPNGPIIDAIDNTNNPILSFIKKNFRYWPVLAVLLGILFIFSLRKKFILRFFLDIEWSKLWKVVNTVRPTVQEAFGKKLFPPKKITSMASGFKSNNVGLLSSKLDIVKSIEKSVSLGGWPSPVYETPKLQLEYLFLIDSASSNDHLANFALMLAKELRKQHVNIDTYTFDKDPRLCFPEKLNNPPLNLNQLVVKYYNYRLIIFSDATNWLDPWTGKVQAWVEKYLTRWSERVLLTPREKITWRKLEKEIIAAYIKVLPLSTDPKQLKQLVKSFHSPKSINNKPTSLFETYPRELYLRPKRWLEEDAPEPEVIDKVLTSLRIYLGKDGFYWLCACAVFPKVLWELTFYLRDELIIDQNKFFIIDKELLMKKLGRLPWFQYGYMPNWLRSKLIRKLNSTQKRKIFKAIQNYLREGSSTETTDAHNIEKILFLKERPFFEPKANSTQEDLLEIESDILFKRFVLPWLRLDNILSVFRPSKLLAQVRKVPFKSITLVLLLLVNLFLIFFIINSNLTSTNNNTTTPGTDTVDNCTALKIISQQEFDSFLDTSPSECLTAVRKLELNNDDRFTVGNDISNIDKLYKLPNLEDLNLSKTNVTDITALRQLRGLQVVNLSYNAITDVSPLAVLANLQVLDLSESSVANVSALKSLGNLRQLYLNNTGVTSISSPFNLTNLETLHLNNTGIVDIAGLKDLTNLKKLYLHESPIKDISPLQDLTNLEVLRLNNTAVTDTEVIALSGLTNLHTLYLSAHINNISTLTGLTNLKELHLSNSKINDITAISNFNKLDILYLNDIDNNQNMDISSLSAENLSSLKLLELNNQTTRQLNEGKLIERENAVPHTNFQIRQQSL